MIKIIRPDSGESIEEEMRRTTATKEPIENVAPMIYTERSEGVKPEYDIRTDRFDIAIDALDKYSKSGNAHRDEVEWENKNKEQTKVETPKNE